MFRIALDGINNALFHLDDDGNAIDAVTIFAQEQQVTRSQSVVLIHRPIKTCPLPFQSHRLGACIGGSLHPCIMQAEGGKHRRPIAVGVAVPLSVAGDAPSDTQRIHLKVPFAFGLTQLGFGDLHHHLCGGGLPLHLRQTHLPVLFGLQIGGDVAVTTLHMNVLLQRTDGDFITRLDMDVFLCLFQRTEEPLSTCLRMNVLVVTAEGLARQRDAGQFQAPKHTKDHQ